MATLNALRRPLSTWSRPCAAHRPPKRFDPSQGPRTRDPGPRDRFKPEPRPRPSPPTSFEDVLPIELVQALKESFTHIRQPTPAQLSILHAVQHGHNLVLKDRTGRGKSFALLLALLALPRREPHNANLGPRALLLVPHAGLATQYLSWLHRLLLPSSHSRRALNPHFPTSLSSTAQLLIRPTPSLPSPPNDVVLSNLHSKPPHVLIATPTRLNDLLLADRNPRLLHRSLARTPLIAMDEIDALLSLPPTSLPRSSPAWKKWYRHVPTTIEVIERLRLAREQLLPGEKVKLGETGMVMCSATVGKEVWEWVRGESEWFDDADSVGYEDFSSAVEGEGQGEGITHHAVVVSSRSDSPSPIRNLDLSAPLSLPHSIHVSPEAESAILIEAIAELFALSLSPSSSSFTSDDDDSIPPTKALLLLPPTISTSKTVSALRSLSVPATSLSLSVASSSHHSHPFSGEPEMWVADSAFAKGLDIPDLTHVFLAFGTETEWEYLHFAGRVGRLGGGSGREGRGKGRVITILREGEQARFVEVVRGLEEGGGRLRPFPLLGGS